MLESNPEVITRAKQVSEMTPKKPSKIKSTWAKLGLDASTLMMMAKGATPPVIATALIPRQHHLNPIVLYHAAGQVYSEFSLQCGKYPRSAPKYQQQADFRQLGICVGSGVVTFAFWTIVKAREHTTPKSPQSLSPGPAAGASTAPYNASASAVAGVWLFANIYFVNTIRASRPQLVFPVIIYSIFINVGMTYGPQFPTMPVALAFIRRLITVMLTGLSVGTAVSFFIIPVTCREVVFKQAAGYIGLVRGTLKAQTAYIQSLEEGDMFGTSVPSNGPMNENVHTERRVQSKAGTSDKLPTLPKFTPETINLRAAIKGLTTLHGKIHGDMAFAKREIAYGKLDASDLDEMFRLFRSVLLPIIGMSTLMDIFDRITESRGWRDPNEHHHKRDSIQEWERVPSMNKEQEKAEWNNIMKSLHRPFEGMTQAMDEALLHVSLTLELTKAPKAESPTTESEGKVDSADDVEAHAGVVRPGEKGFAKFFETKTQDFYNRRATTLGDWCKHQGISLPENVADDPYIALASLQHLPMGADKCEQHRRIRQQLYLILYMEFLLYSTGKAVLDLVRFADIKVQSGAMEKNRIIIPAKARLMKWITGMMKIEDSTVDHQNIDDVEMGAQNVYLGDSLRPKKDPEHLPPATAWESFGNKLRFKYLPSHSIDTKQVIPRFFSSSDSAYGLRVAAATFTIGICAYLHNSQHFFIEQRLVWAMIMVSISMTTTAGASTFGFFGRLAGTTVAMVMSLVNYYIVDGKTAGIIVFLWVFLFFGFYVVLKFPRWSVAAVLGMVTQVLIIGYELEVRKIGKKIATSNGQPYYPIYLLAPYRLATVAGGLAVAFIWTFFPYPITARSQLRKQLGASLYLLANFYSIVHTTVTIRLEGNEGDMEHKNSPGRRLERLRHKVFAKELLLLSGLREHSAMTAWEFSIGGQFPRYEYDSIIQGVQNILNYMTLISYSTATFSENYRCNEQKWFQDFSKLVQKTNITTHEITSMLSLLSNSVTNGQPLPPYLKAPKPYQLSQDLEEMDKDILDISHIAEPGYAAFAVIQVASTLISDDLKKLIGHVKALVGEVDFSYHVISTTDPGSDNSSSEALFAQESNGKGKTE
ncbi:MAG: hypothetical protein M1827_006214 [Pycnora praestabilis]|nr:MAG: hypothetical protein M1827_006214 [Pycnora praestabilis]